MIFLAVIESIGKNNEIITLVTINKRLGVTTKHSGILHQQSNRLLIKRTTHNQQDPCHQKSSPQPPDVQSLPVQHTFKLH
jgi:hypothetical protein